jgi:hypothetical protein
MTAKLCEECGQPLSAERLKALPTATRCVNCEEKYDAKNKTIGAMLWSSKHAPEIQLSTASGEGESGRDAIRAILRHSRRGTHAQLPLVPKGIAEKSFAASPTDAPAEFDAVRAFLRDEASSVPRDRSDTSNVANIVPARCHPSRASVGPSRLCLACAVKWYETRRKR